MTALDNAYTDIGQHQAGGRGGFTDLVYWRKACSITAHTTDLAEGLFESSPQSNRAIL